MSANDKQGRDPLIPSSPSHEAYRVDEDQGDVFHKDEPIALFRDWLALAREKEANDPNAMALATIDEAGMPDVRIVLLKDIDEDGLSFYTNLTSAKGEALLRNPVAAIVFHWKSIRRQVRFRGKITQIDDAQADAYFATRARGAQIGAWASDQSAVMDHDKALIERVEQWEAKFEGKPVPRPAHWSGFQLQPESIEFWVNRPYRLHDRLLFRKVSAQWKQERLYP